MSIEGIDVESTLEKAKLLLKEDKNISPSVQAIMEVLIVLVSLLVNRLGVNSRNSHTPPSKDPLNHRSNKSPGRKKKAGGQKGHIGSTLKKTDTPDTIEDIKIDRRSLPRGHYRNADYESRQVFDVKVSLHVTEYRAEVVVDRQGRRFVADFPVGVTNAVQYGSEVKAQSV